MFKNTAVAEISEVWKIAQHERVARKMRAGEI